MGRRPCAVVVTGDLELAGTWMAWLRATGHMTLGCAGPVRTDACPHANGRRCPLRDTSVLTIVDALADPSDLCGSIGHQRRVTIGAFERSTLDRRGFGERVRALPGAP